jgi:hypothetical protein
MTLGGANTSRMTTLRAQALSSSLSFSRHYNFRLSSRPTPSVGQIQFILCDDAPKVIEDYPERDRYLICGTTDNDGRVGHLVCTNPPNSMVITAYFPGETEPDKWENDYRKRKKG